MSPEPAELFERVETHAQIAAVVSLAREIWVPHYVPLIGAAQVDYMLERYQSPAAIERQIRDEGYEYYVARGTAYLAIAPNHPRPGVAHLSKIYVHPAKQREGWGRAVMALAEQRCRDLSCRELWLTVNKGNTGSIAFYERLGFRKTGALVMDIGEGYVMDDWRMAKTL